MKRVLLAFSFCCLATIPVMAQNSKPKPVAAPAKVDLKASFSNKLKEFKDVLSRDNNEASMKTYMELFELMHKAMAANNEKLTKLTKPEEKDAMQKRIVEEQTLYGEIKAMLGDLSNNKTQIISKLETYLGTI